MISILFMNVNAQWDCYIPYTINSNLQVKDSLKMAISIFNKQTKLTLVERTTEDDYIEFVDGIDCASRLGRIGGKQLIILNKGCTIFNQLHEILHAIGFNHEHTRRDRNQYIIVNYNNIMDKYLTQYYPVPINDFNGITEYDFESVMHYNLFSFSKNSNNYTIRPIIPQNVTIGQNYKLSENDLFRINTRYSFCTKEVKSPECRESDVEFFAGNINPFISSYYKFQSFIGSGIPFIDSLYTGYTKEYTKEYTGDSSSDPVIKKDINGNWIIIINGIKFAYSNSNDLFTLNGWFVLNILTKTEEFVPSAKMKKRICSNIIPDYKYTNNLFWFITIPILLLLIISCCCCCRRRYKKTIENVV